MSPMPMNGEFVGDLAGSGLDAEVSASAASPTPPDPSRAISALQYVPKKTKGVQSASTYQGLKRSENLD
jgi:hypothetical protein